MENYRPNDPTTDQNDKNNLISHTSGDLLSQIEDYRGVKSTAHFSVDFISVQGLLFDCLSMAADDIYCFQLHALFRDHTYHSSLVDVVDVSKPIVFNQSIKFDNSISFTDNSESHRPTILAYVTCCRKKEVCKLMEGLGTCNHTVLAQATIDYSIASLHSGDFISVELSPCLVDYIYVSGESPASLFLRFNLSESAISNSTRQVVEESMQAHQTSITKYGRDTIQQLKSWWSQLRSEYSYVGDRQLKFVTEDECGRHRFVGNFVSAVKPGRELNGPRYAARFVSLIPFKREPSLSGGRVTRWHSPFATLCRLHGDVEDHAVLLCSLLLGWGLNAYVAMGTLHSETDQLPQTHSWVVTVCDTGKITYWESLTGEQTDASSSAMKDAHYREIWALFKQNEFIVNVQADCSCYTTSFELKNSRMWRSFTLPNETCKILSHPGASLRLRDGWSALRAMSVEEELEKQLRIWFRNQRQEQGLQTKYDEMLCTILHPTLASYELDRATGSTFGNAEFQSSVRSLVDRGECFKAYPTCFNHTDLQSIQNTLLRTKAARDIIFAKSKDLGKSKGGVVGRPARFGVRVRIFSYPRGLCAVWIVIATCHQSEGN